MQQATREGMVENKDRESFLTEDLLVVSASGYGTSNQRGNGNAIRQRQKELPDSKVSFVVLERG